jgi:DtxR family Mn-dependent transcriptional regulator
VASRNADTHGIEDYLEAAYELEEEGEPVVQTRIASRLGVSRPTVSGQVRRLVGMKLVEVDDDRRIRLTPHGRSVAEDAVRRHRMAERFLTDVLRLPWHKAHEEAGRFQNAISGDVERRIMTMLGRPATCPHGNPIPGTGAKLPSGLRPLNEFGAGASVVLERLLEDVELHTDVLKYFEEHGLMPGGVIRILSVAPDGTMTLEVGRKRSALGADLADNLWVRPAPARRRRA